MAMIRIPGATLHVSRSGNGPPMLFIGGLGGRVGFWNAQISAVKDFRDAIAFEHRGIGDSSPHAGAYSVRLLAGDTVGLMDSMGIDAADIVGHSMGASVAQHLAVHYPDRVAKLVLSAAWPGPSPLLLELFGLRRAVLEACGAEAYLMLGAVMTSPPGWLENQFVSAEQFLSPRLAAFPGAAVECRRIDAVMAHDLRDEVGRITAETLVLCARDDLITPPGLSHELAALIPRSRIVELAEGGHFAPVTAAKHYNAALSGFIGTN